MMEDKMSLENYLAHLGDKHERWLRIPVDLTLILDGSEAMPELPDWIRESISGFIGQFDARAKERARHISRYRVRVIVFRQDEQGCLFVKRVRVSSSSRRRTRGWRIS